MYSAPPAQAPLDRPPRHPRLVAGLRIALFAVFAPLIPYLLWFQVWYYTEFNVLGRPSVKLIIGLVLQSAPALAAAIAARMLWVLSRRWSRRLLLMYLLVLLLPLGLITYVLMELAAFYSHWHWSMPFGAFR